MAAAQFLMTSLWLNREIIEKNMHNEILNHHRQTLVVDCSEYYYSQIYKVLAMSHLESLSPTIHVI